MALDRETRVSFDISAKWTNRMSVTSSPITVRLAFGEAAPGEDTASSFHSAVMMSRDDATSLRDLLTRLLTEPA